MKLTGLLGWKRRTGDEAGRAPAPGPFSASPADLELEKRWLQLARVDTDEFRHFFDKYHDHVFGYLAATVGNEETAQDLTQETFLYALENLWRFNWQGGSFGIWLFHIARRRVLPRYWRSSRRASEAEFARRYLPASSAPVADTNLERAAMLARLRSAVLELSPQRRDAYVLHVQLEHSLADTALLMGVKPATVLSLLQRGRRQLAEALRRERVLTAAERQLVSAILAGERGLVPVGGDDRKADGDADEDA